MVESKLPVGDVEASSVSDTTSAPSGQTAGDPRFTFGLALDVARVLAEHGYPAFTAGAELVELEMHLLHLLHGRELGYRMCQGGAR